MEEMKNDNAKKESWAWLAPPSNTPTRDENTAAWAIQFPLQ
jgi:hypothetical protein